MPEPTDFMQIAGVTDEDKFTFGQTAAMGINPASPDIPPELKAALDRMRVFAAHQSVASAEAQRPVPPDKLSYETKPDGTKIVKSETSAQNFENTVRSAQKWHEALGGNFSAWTRS